MALKAEDKAISEMLEVESKDLLQLKEDEAMLKEDLVEALVEDREANIWQIMGEDSTENLAFEKFKTVAKRNHMLDVEETVLIIQDVKKKIKNCAKLEQSKWKIKKKFLG